jgi:hypothetical protein
MVLARDVRPHETRYHSFPEGELLSVLEHDRGQQMPVPLAGISVVSSLTSSFAIITSRLPEIC